LAYEVKRSDLESLEKKEKEHVCQSVFTTSVWLSFLEKNQKIEPIILELYDNAELVAIFVGGLVKKMGIRILASPFEGWLTPDMGFVEIQKFDVNKAVKSVAKYAFSELRCWLVQIQDKKISPNDLDKRTITGSEKLLYINISGELENVLENFTKNGRRDVRASQRKGVIFEKVDFNRDFVDIYYQQLEDVFAKQNLKPFYSKTKLYDLVDAFENNSDFVAAFEAKLDNGQCIASVFSFGYEEYAYYMGAASFREYQKFLPNEGLFWEFVKYWNGRGIKKIDLVGDREYKRKYAPKIIENPIIIYERVPGIFCLKKLAKKIVQIKRGLESRGAYKK